MNFTCNECNDSGSRDKLGTYLDCNACGTAATRRDLNDFVKSLGPTHPEDVALAIHQRALAMAPKQEAPAGKLSEMELNHAFDYVTKPWAYVRNEDISRSRAYFKAGYKYAFESAPHSQMSSADHAAPAAANGAPEPTMINGRFYYTAEQMLAAAGPDAALIKALEKAEKKFLEIEHMLGGGDDEVSVEVEILTIRAALSGAKGN